MHAGILPGFFSARRWNTEGRPRAMERGGASMRATARSVLGMMVAAVGLGAGSLFGPARADAAASTFEAPVYPGDFPDPSVLLTGGMYWAYATGSAGRNLQVMSSPDLHTWSAPADPLPVLPAWATVGHTWAPGVIELAGKYVMYYTVRNGNPAMQCISVATSATPGGPFVDRSSQPLVCQAPDGGSIDPNPYRDPGSGHLYLIWKSDDNSIGQNTHIWAQRLASGGLSFVAGERAEPTADRVGSLAVPNRGRPDADPQGRPLLPVLRGKQLRHGELGHRLRHVQLAAWGLHEPVRCSPLGGDDRQRPGTARTHDLHRRVRSHPHGLRGLVRGGRLRKWRSPIFVDRISRLHSKWNTDAELTVTVKSRGVAPNCR